MTWTNLMFGKLKVTLPNLLISVVVLVVAIFAFLYLPQKLGYKLVTQEDYKVAAMEVSSISDEASATLEGKDESRIFSYLSTSGKAKRSGGNSVQLEPCYLITVTYEDGKIDVINCMPEKTDLSANAKWYFWRDGKRYFEVDRYAVTMNELEAYLA